MSIEFIPTNDAFAALLKASNIHKDKALIISLFARAGIKVSKSKLKSWSTKSGVYQKEFRPMPKEVLELFIAELNYYIHSYQMDNHVKK